MKKVSFRRLEHKILPGFRRRINEAESTEDVKKTFGASARAILEKAFEGRATVGYEDVNFTPHEPPYFSVSRRLLDDEHAGSIWKDSDLQQTIEGLAESAMNRYKHLEKHREKTDSKIRMGFF